MHQVHRLKTIIPSYIIFWNLLIADFQRKFFPQIRQLFAGIDHPLPSETTCRDQIDILFETEMKRVSRQLKNKSIFVMADKSEICDQKYFNIFFGSTDIPPVSFLVDCVPMAHSPNHSFVLQIVDTKQHFQIPRQCFALLIADTARQWNYYPKCKIYSL